ncbi:MAG: carbohydrate binding family 9 domain-containing protein [Thermoanaerobaculia bacterium]|nr:carbohydrate binding family 9 domain-containing protein [Thermoanaerobaculia bacterium]
MIRCHFARWRFLPVLLSFLFSVSVLVGPLMAQESPVQTAAESPEPLPISRASSSIEVDGVLDEPAWANALKMTIGYEWFPGDNAEPPVATDVFLTYDDDAFYVGFVAYDPDPSAIRAHLMDRDTIGTFVQDDHVTFMIDTFNDERRAFQFRINPLGVQADALFSQVEFIEDFSWDVIWDSAGRITTEGYVVEVALPLDQIRFPETEGPQTWGVELGRSYPRDRRHRMSANPRDRDRTCLLCQVDKVRGFEGIEPGRNLEVTPTVTGLVAEARPGFPGGDFETEEEDGEVGVSMRWGITQALTLNAAYNPDFSQVEADAAQLNVNERFALFFEEKRPFFLEGVDFFATPINAVFTRTVVDPEFGLKLTGKQGANAGGAFVTRDEVNSLVFPSNQGSRQTLTREAVDGAVARYRRDIGQGGAVGVLLTSRSADEYENQVAGIDGFLRLGQVDELRFQYLASESRYADDVALSFGQPLGDFNGDAFEVSYAHNARNWAWNAKYEDLEPGFRADFGFVPRVDLRQLSGGVQRTVWGGEDDAYDQLNFGGSWVRAEDHEGDLTDREIDIFANFRGPLQSFVEVATSERTRVVRGVRHDGLQLYEAVGQFQPGAIGKVVLFVADGETVDFSNNRPADMTIWNPQLEMKLGRHFNAQLSHVQQTLDAPEGEILDVGLSELKVVWNFSLRSFLRAIVQYQNLDRNPELFVVPVEEKVETLFTQLLFSYKLNPQTVLFLGYSDNSLGVEDSRFPLQSVSLTQTDRTLFFKLGYAFTF